jgi:hypothetical protein
MRVAVAVAAARMALERQSMDGQPGVAGSAESQPAVKTKLPHRH